MTWRDLVINTVVGVGCFLLFLASSPWEIALRVAVAWLALLCAYDETVYRLRP